MKRRRSTLRPGKLLGLGLVVLLGSGPALAESPYRLAPAREWTLLGAGAAMGVTGLALADQREPFTEAELAGLDVADLNGFDRAGMEPFRATWDGDALAYASLALPLTLLADARTREDWKNLGCMWGEVLLLQAGLTGLTKGLVERARPYAYDPGAPLEERTRRSATQSFFSGHTSATAATCYYLARVVSDYPFSKTTKTLAWGTAAIYPAVVGFLRVDSGHHFRTDVLTGYLVGAAIGYLVPQLHRASLKEQAAVQTSLSGGQLTLTFNF
jgi:membrane-associated phospholipid phosphatase